MRKILLLPLVLMMALTMQAEVTHLRIEMLAGDELTSSLAQIGKIVLGENDVLLYNKSGVQIGSTPFLQFGKIVFYSDGSTALDEVTDSSVQVYYDATQENIFVRGIEDQQVVRVYTTSGKLLLSTATNNGEAVMHIGGLTNGVYLLQAGAQVVKVIKE